MMIKNQYSRRKKKRRTFAFYSFIYREMRVSVWTVLKGPGKSERDSKVARCRIAEKAKEKNQRSVFFIPTVYTRLDKTLTNDAASDDDYFVVDNTRPLSIQPEGKNSKSLASVLTS
jgi:hypothetical protein